jgi:hypothetical protein
MPNRPHNPGATVKVNNHGLSSVEGRFHDYVWQCRFCGERRREKLAYTDFECE